CILHRAKPHLHVNLERPLVPPLSQTPCDAIQLEPDLRMRGTSSVEPTSVRCGSFAEFEAIVSDAGYVLKPIDRALARRQTFLDALVTVGLHAFVISSTFGGTIAGSLRNAAQTLGTALFDGLRRIRLL